MISLRIIQLAKSFGSKTVFSEVSFEHQENVLGIAGSNGSGKSTFLKCLGQLLRPSHGTIEWRKDDNIIDETGIRQKLGYAAPYISLYDELSCRENLEFLSKIRHEPDSTDAIETWIGKVGLKEVKDQPFGKLSTGQQQRLRLASALFHDPDILLLDEPGANLDEAGRDLITEIVDSYKMPDNMLIIASNNPQELNHCERIFSIEQEYFV